MVAFLPTPMASVWFALSVFFHVKIQLPSLFITLATCGTLVWVLTGVFVHLVIFKRSNGFESLLTHVTLVWPFRGV